MAAAKEKIQSQTIKKLKETQKQQIVRTSKIVVTNQVSSFFLPSFISFYAFCIPNTIQP
jgi:predicted Holliday junction resolvase-like endonuclease